MHTEYSDQDTAGVRQAEGSSAGQQTQQLSNPSPYTPLGTPAPTASAPSNNNNIAALALIAVGVVMLLGRFMPGAGELTGGMILLTIASCFFFFGLWKHIYGLIIPASILGGLSVGVTFASVSNGVSIMWGLALGFLSIFLLGNAMFNKRSQWPIYPAVVLFAVGVIIAIANLPSLFLGMFIWLPLLLIVLGLYLGWRRTAY